MSLSRQLILCLLLSFSINIQAQVQISGMVKDALTGKPLAGATISDPLGVQGTETKADGTFSFRTTSDSLIVRFVGYQNALLTELLDEGYYRIALEANNLLETVSVGAEGPQLTFRSAEAVSLLQKRDLKRLQQLSPQTILNQVPGVYMQSGALNTNRITIRGVGNRSPFGTAKIRAFLDDIPLTNGVGETTIEDIDLSLLESIEVYKGPTASNYGAALGGLIHMRTTQPDQATNQIGAQYEIGDYGLSRQVIQSQYANAEEQLLLQLNYNRTHSDGYRDNNEYDRESFTAIGKIGDGDRHQSTVLVNYTDVKAFIPSSLNETDFLNEPSKAAFPWAQVRGFEDYERVLAGLSHTYDWLEFGAGNQISTTLSLFGSYRDNYESRPFNILRETNWSTGYRLTTDFRKGAQRRTPNIQVGIESYNESYQWTTNVTNDGVLGNLLSDNNERRSYLNAFASANWDLGERWLLKAGLNFNQTNYDLEDLFPDDDKDISGDYAFESVWSPRLSLAYQFTPLWSVFATISHGFSVPTLEETLNPDGSRNPDIQPERGWNYELGSKGAYLNGKLHYDISVYSMQIQDLLVARRTALDQFVGINAGETVHNGLEASLRYQWWTGLTQLTTQLSYSYADYRFERFSDGDNDFSGNELTGTAPHQVGAWLDFTSKIGIYTNLIFEYVDAFPMRDDNSIYSEAYSVFNTKIGWRKTVNKSWDLDVYMGINNLFDTAYASMILINAGSFGGSLPRYYYPGLPRNFFGGVQLNYRW